MVSEKNKRKAWMVWIGGMLTALCCAVAFGAPALLYGYILERTGCSPTQFSLIFSLMGVGLMCGHLITGGLVEKNPRLYPGIGAFAVLILYASIALSANIYIIMVCALIFGILDSMMAAMFNQVMIAHWFKTGRAKLVSLLCSCQNLGYVIFNPLIAKTVVACGPENAALIIGISSTVISLISVFILCGGFPERFGMKAIDFGKNDEEKREENREESAYDCRLPYKTIIRTPVFIGGFAAVFLFAMGIQIYNANSVMIFQSFGMEYEQAALCTSIYSFAAMIGLIVVGIVLDKFGTRKGVTIMGAVLAAACLFTPFFHGWSGCVIFAVLMSFGGFWMLIGPSLMAPVFGLKKSGNLVSWLAAAGSACSIIAPPFSTTIYGATGSYVTPFIVAGTGVILAIIIVQLCLSNKAIQGIKEKEKEYIKTHVIF